jgi:hypothetical protein
MNNPESEMRWLCREKIDMDSNIANGVARHKKWSQLVWGRWENAVDHKNGQTSPAKIVGEVYHELHGPTAESAISAYAEDLNFRRIPPSKVPSFKPANNKKPDPNQPMLSLTGADLGKTKPKQ